MIAASALELTPDLLLRLATGALAGMAIGWQRARSHKVVGIRTLGLIGLAAAFTATIATAAQPADPSNIGRVLQGILTGIGFIGAGVILHGRGPHRVHGLTTAAAIWLAALLGAGSGAGFYALAAMGTVMGLLLLALPETIDRPERDDH
jgi:putative Mg2+ transporter-C (MgtC) family protein